jgi:molybdopterin converting factor small subunit
VYSLGNIDIEEFQRVNYLGTVRERNGRSKADVPTRTNKDKLQTFINKSPRKILKIHWPNKINNIELWNKTKQEPEETTVK